MSSHEEMSGGTVMLGNAIGPLGEVDALVEPLDVVCVPVVVVVEVVVVVLVEDATVVAVAAVSVLVAVVVAAVWTALALADAVVLSGTVFTSSGSGVLVREICQTPRAISAPTTMTTPRMKPVFPPPLRTTGSGAGAMRCVGLWK